MKKLICLLLALLLCSGVAMAYGYGEYVNPWLDQTVSSLNESYGDPLWTEGNVSAWKTGEYMLYAVISQDKVTDYLRLTEQGGYIWLETRDELPREDVRTLFQRSGFARGEADDPLVGMHWAEFKATYGTPFWGGQWLGAWETSEGTLIAGFFHDRLRDYALIAPDRTLLAGTIGPDMTRQKVRDLCKSDSSDPHVHDLGSGRVIPASFTSDGYILTYYDVLEWEVYDCVNQQYAPFWMVLLVMLGL